MEQLSSGPVVGQRVGEHPIPARPAHAEWTEVCWWGSWQHSAQQGEQQWASTTAGLSPERGEAVAGVMEDTIAYSGWGLWRRQVQEEVCQAAPTSYEAIRCQVDRVMPWLSPLLPLQGFQGLLEPDMALPLQ